MSKRRSVLVVDTEKGPKTTKADQDGIFDWKRCFICQSGETENLQSSLQALTGDKEKPYRELSKRIIRFDTIDMLPVPLNIDRLKDGEVTLDSSLIRHEAKFHKSCKNKFGKDKLDRAVQKYEKSRNNERGIH